MGDPVNPKWLPGVPANSKWLTSGFSGQYSILNSIGSGPTGGLDTSVLLSRFPAQYPLVHCTPPCAHMCTTRLCLVGGEGKGGVATLPMYLFQTLPAPYACVDVLRGPILRIFARGRILSNNDVAINIQS